MCSGCIQLFQQAALTRCGKVDALPPPPRCEALPRAGLLHVQRPVLQPHHKAVFAADAELIGTRGRDVQVPGNFHKGGRPVELPASDRESLRLDGLAPDIPAARAVRGRAGARSEQEAAAAVRVRVVSLSGVAHAFAGGRAVQAKVMAGPREFLCSCYRQHCRMHVLGGANTWHTLTRPQHKTALTTWSWCRRAQTHPLGCATSSAGP